MKPFIEKLPHPEDNSFLAQTFTTPHFEVPWHQHIEHEIILFKEGHGASYIGNFVGDFKPGDVFLIGSNLPHTFQKHDKEMVTSALVVQFRDDCWGSHFLDMPEARPIKTLLEAAGRGLRVLGQCRLALSEQLLQLENASGFERVIILCRCLQQIAAVPEYSVLSSQQTTGFQARHKERIDKILRYTIEHFQDPIALSEVAANAAMSVPAFCSYFKKCTKKTYIDFLNEVRVGHACKQLIDTQNKIASVCYESGFNTLANFNKQFLRVKGLTPSAYRKTVRQGHSMPV